MSDNGFIYLDRKFFDHSMWREKRVFSRQEAWLDLIQLARWKKEAHNVAIKDKVITCDRGQLVRSMVTLADRWGWSKSKVKRVLDVFKERGMIRIENETVTTRITLCNYETYQTKDGGSETQAKRKRNASETQVDTEEEGKERKKENTTAPSALEGDFEKAWIAYGRKGHKSTSLKYWKNLSQTDRDEIAVKIPLYVAEQNEPQYQKDFQGWINPTHKRWQNLLKSELTPKHTPTKLTKVTVWDM